MQQSVYSKIPNDLSWDKETDVVVIGYGGAGATTAITTFDSGAKVIVIEKSPSLYSLGITGSTNPITRISGGGGNTHISNGDIVSPSDPVDAAKYLYSACGGTTPMDVCTAWAEEVCKNAAWCREMGIKGSINENKPTEYLALPGSSAMTVFSVMGWGANFFARLDKQVQERGIEVLFATAGRELIQNHNANEIIGVRAENQGESINIRATKGVVLCTGGFEFNEEMKNRFLKCWPMKFYGWGYNTGDGIKMAQKVGADLWHMDVLTGGNCSWFNDPEYDFGMSTRTRTNNYVWVNKFGCRYCDEVKSFHPHGGWVTHLERNTAYPGFSRIPSYIIFDEIARLAGPIGSDEAVKGGMPFGRILLPKQLGGWEGWSQDNLREIERGWIRKGDTLETLAKEIGGEMIPSQLIATISEYNEYCVSGTDLSFGRTMRTLVPIENPPYYAVPLYPGLVSTCGGPVRSAKAEIMNPDGNPIPRLYSAGSCGSVYGRTYSVTGGNLGELCAFGRIAGRQVAALKPWDQAK
jgi:succinate dehydrogenase/fumarate reductase flavoprotein subunit